MIAVILILAAFAAGGYWLYKHEGALTKVRGELLVLQAVYAQLKGKIDP